MPVKAQFPGEQSEAGEFERQEDAFRDFVSIDGSTPYPAVAGRYHLYISLACPWASRTLIVRNVDGAGRRDWHDRGRSGPRRARLGVSRWTRLQSRSNQRLRLPERSVCGDRSELRRSRHRAGLVGQGNPPNCQQLRG